MIEASFWIIENTRNEEDKNEWNDNNYTYANINIENKINPINNTKEDNNEKEKTINPLLSFLATKI